MSVESSFKKWMSEGSYSKNERDFAEKVNSKGIRGMSYYAGYMAGKKESCQPVTEEQIEP